MSINLILKMSVLSISPPLSSIGSLGFIGRGRLQLNLTLRSLVGKEHNPFLLLLELKSPWMNLTLHSIYFFKCYYSLGMEIKGHGLKDHGRAMASNRSASEFRHASSSTIIFHLFFKIRVLRMLCIVKAYFSNLVQMTALLSWTCCMVQR